MTRSLRETQLFQAQLLLLLLAMMMMRAILLLGSISSIARANVNLEAYRADTTPLPNTIDDYYRPDEYTQWYERYSTALRADVAPLCGNGVVDTVDTYTDYYTLHPPTPYGNETNTKAFLINEVCDDGNRFDGDGCSADCLSLDAFTPPCPLAGASQLLSSSDGETFRFVTFINATTLLAVTSAKRLLFADGYTLALLSARTLTDDIASGWRSPHDGVIWLYSSVVGSVWRVDVASSSSGVSIRRLLTLPVVVAGDNGVWWTDGTAGGNNMMLVTASMQFVNLTSGRVRRAANYNVSYGKLVGVRTFDTETHGVMRIGCSFVRELVTRYLRYDIGGNGTIADDTQMGDIADFDGVFAYIPWVGLYYHLYNAQPESMQPFRPPKLLWVDYPLRERQTWENDLNSFNNAPVVAAHSISVRQETVRDFIMHNDNYAVVLGVGEPWMRIAMQRSLSIGACAGADKPCIADMPLSYDVLAENPYAYTSRTSTTLYTTAVAIANTDIVSGSLTAIATWRAILAAITPSVLASQPPPITQLLPHPVTGAIWVVRGSSLYEIGRRGVLMTTQARTCVPSYAGVCPAGSWAPPNLACRLCTLAVPTERAWHQQCLSTTGQSVSLSFAFASNNYSSVDQAVARLRLAPNLRVNGTIIACVLTPPGRLWLYAYACNVSLVTTADVPTAMRTLRAMVDYRSFAFLTPPHVKTPAVGFGANTAVVANNADASASESSALSTGAIVGIVLGSVVGVGAIMAGVYFLQTSTLHHNLAYNNNYAPVQQQPPYFN
jgi:cysteine-rich repeat protein